MSRSEGHLCQILAHTFDCGLPCSVYEISVDGQAEAERFSETGMTSQGPDIVLAYSGYEPVGRRTNGPPVRHWYRPTGTYWRSRGMNYPDPETIAKTWGQDQVQSTS